MCGADMSRHPPFQPVLRAAAVIAAAVLLGSSAAALGAKPSARPAAVKPAVAKPAVAKPAAAKPAAAKPAAAKPAVPGSFSSKWRSPRNNQRPRRSTTKFIILHTTEGAAKGALEKLSANGECHYVVDVDGVIYSIVDRPLVAFHAGLSMWNAETGLDSVSVGIEVVGWHDKPVSAAQVAALRKLLAELKAKYKVPDDRVLMHSMVAFGNPTHWHKRKHRGRKRCGMQFADPDLRRRIGLESKPAFDPDLRAGRLFDADPELTAILYRKPQQPRKQPPSIVSAGPGGKPQPPQDPSKKPDAAQMAPHAAPPAAAPRNVIGPRRSAWDIARDQYDSPATTYRFPNGTVKKGSEISGREWRAMPAGTVVTVGDPGDSPRDNSDEGLLEIGAEGAARDLAGDEIASSSTFYFPPGGGFSSGATLTLAQIEALPAGTKVLVGYKSGGPVSGKRPVFSICGPAWNHPDTFYWDPLRRRIVPGDGIGEKSIPKGATVFWR